MNEKCLKCLLGNIDDEIEQLLQKKQENKEFKDAGKRTGYSRKERAAYKTVISSKDLENIEKNEATAIDLVQKKKVFPPINYDIEINAGVSSGCAFLKDYLQKSYPAKPNKNTATHREVYVKSAEYLMQKLEVCYSISDLKSNFYDGFVDLYNEVIVPITHDEPIRYAGAGDAQEYFSVSFYNTIRMIGGYSPTKDKVEIMKKAKRYDGISKEMAEDNLKRVKENVEYRNERFTKSLEKLNDIVFFSDILVYEREHAVMSGGYIPKYKKEKDVEGYKKYVKSVIERWIGENNKKLLPENLPFEAKESPPDWSWLVKTQRKKGEKSASTFERTPLSHIKRTGGIEISEISEKIIIDHLGFTGVTLGNYVKDNEAKEHIRYFISAIADLCEITNLNQFEMNKRLSIGFGAYGRGGKAMATYYPTLQTINLTKRNGDGSVAHEYGHFLDNYLQNFNNAEMYMSEKAYSFIFANFSSWDKKTLQNKHRSFQNEYFAKSLIKTINAYKHLGSIFESMLRLIVYIRFGVVTFPDESFNVFSKSNNSSEYYIFSKQMPNSNYWASPVEMFARGFEVYIYDKLSINNRENNYLVNGETFHHPIYPQGNDRKNLYSLYDNLISSIKDERSISDFFAWSNTRTDEYISVETTTNKIKTGVVVSSKKETDKDKRQRMKLKRMRMLQLAI